MHDHLSGPGSPRTVFHFEFYGLAVSSEIPLPGWPECAPTREAEVFVVRGSVDAPDPEGDGVFARCMDECGDFVANWRGYGRFAVRGGSRIVVDAEAESDATGIGLFVGGPLMAVILQSRGRVVLHGGAVEIGGRAVLVLGQSGAGKSTTVAALLERGHRFVTDDLCVLDRSDGVWRIDPAPPLVKLKDESLSAIGHDPREYEEFGRAEEKRRFAPGVRSEARLPLAAALLLEWGEKPRVSRTTSGEAFFGLRANSFTIHVVEDLGWNERHFAMCGELAREVPVLRLRRPRDLAALDAVAALIEETLPGIPA